MKKQVRKDTNASVTTKEHYPIKQLLQGLALGFLAGFLFAYMFF